MEFNILERLMILRTLPAQADFISIKIMEDLRRDVSFSQEELDKGAIIEKEDRSVTWDSTKDFTKEIKIVNRAAEIIKKKLIELSESEDVSAQYISIFEKFDIEIDVVPEDLEEYKPKRKTLKT